MWSSAASHRSIYHLLGEIWLELRCPRFSTMVQFSAACHPRMSPRIVGRIQSRRGSPGDFGDSSMKRIRRSPGFNRVTRAGGVMLGLSRTKTLRVRAPLRRFFERYE